MFDVALIRNDQGCRGDAGQTEHRRTAGYHPLPDDKRLELVRHIITLREKRNKVTEQIPACQDPEEKQSLIGSNRKLRQQILGLEEELRGVEHELRELILRVPNMIAPDVPYGEDESGNVEIKRWNLRISVLSP